MKILNAVTTFSARGYESSAMRSDRDTEHDVFMRITRLMREAERKNSAADRIYAVYRNSELWTVLAADLADPANALPDDVKAGLLSLAIFSLRHGKDVSAGKADIAPLIEVNLSIMRGLRGDIPQ